jgi:hypothetical protein
MIQIKLFSDCFTTLINPNLHSPREKNNIYICRDTGKKERRHPGYRHYSSLTLSGGLQAADGGTFDNRDFKARWVRAERVSISSLDRFVM